MLTAPFVKPSQASRTDSDGGLPWVLAGGLWGLERDPLPYDSTKRLSPIVADGPLGPGLDGHTYDPASLKGGGGLLRVRARASANLDPQILGSCSMVLVI